MPVERATGRLRGHSQDPKRNTTASQVDGIERRFGVRRVPGYPLYLSIHGYCKVSYNLRDSLQIRNRPTI